MQVRQRAPLCDFGCDRNLCASPGDYPTPVNVNGFSCKNCTDVDNAEKLINPAKPNDGPFGIIAKDRPEDIARATAKPFDPTYAGQAAVTFGGQLVAFTERLRPGNPWASPQVLVSISLSRSWSGTPLVPECRPDEQPRQRPDVPTVDVRPLQTFT